MTNADLEIGPPVDGAEVRVFAETVAHALFFPGAGLDLEAWVAREGCENVRVARRQGGVVGGLIAQRMGQWFGGKRVGTACIRAVGVAPHERATGVASRLMRAALEEAHREGLPLSTLYPATLPVYRRQGFEQAGVRLTYRLPTHGIDIRDRGLELRPIEPPDHEAICHAYAERARRTSGNLDRNPWAWQRILDPPPWGKPNRGYLVARDERVEGYVIYVQKTGDTLRHSHEIELADFVALTADAGRRLLTFFADHRSIAESLTFHGAPADPVFYLLAEHVCSVTHRMDWMLRIVDVRGALEARAYPAGVKAELHLDVRDDILAHNNRRFLLDICDSRGQVREGGNGSLRIDIRGLAPVYTGHLSPAELRTTGYVDGTDYDLHAADAIFAGPAPWMPDVF